MKDNNLFYIELENGMLKIYPKNGYKMLDLKRHVYCSEAIVTERKAADFVSVP